MTVAFEGTEIIPFTLIVILPTNKQLLTPALDRRSAKTESLIWRMPIADMR